MTAETLPAHGLSIRTFLLGGEQGDQDDLSALQAELSRHGILKSGGEALVRLTGDAGQVVEKELAAVTANLAELDLGDVLLSGWRKYRQIREAAEATLAAPGSEELVQLGSHRITGSYEPTIDLLIDRVIIHTFQITIELVLDVDAVVLVIQRGRLTDLRSGDLGIDCTLTVDDAKLLHKEGRLELLPLLHLGAGIPLLTSLTEPSEDPAPGGADEPAQDASP
jgi:hypothetical protein